MKKTPRNICLAAVLLTSSPLNATAADYFWTGASDHQWSNDLNWADGEAPGSATNPVVNFNGTAGGSSTNDVPANKQIGGLVFSAEAGAYFLDGNDVNLYGNLISHSPSAHTIDFKVNMAWGGRTFEVNAGELTLNQGVGQANGGGFDLTKAGLGAMVLKGDRSYTGATQINAGTLFDDYTGGGTTATTRYRFGNTSDVSIGNTAILQLLGASSVSRLHVNNNAANQLVVNSAVTSAMFERFGSSTFNFNISNAGASMALTTLPVLTNGLIARSTVTDGSKTGFATLSGNNVVRFVPTLALEGSGGGAADNRQTSGEVALTAGQHINTLTISGQGKLTGAHTMRVGAVLMEEGVGNYQFENTQLGAFAPLELHQYSTAGTLTISGRILDVDAAANRTLIKAGAGEVVVSEESSSSYQGATFVQSGRFEVNGSLTKTEAVTVFDGGTLAGGGAIGTAASTVVTLRAGAELEAASSASLNITGSLVMEASSAYSFTLDGTGADSLSVSGDISLSDVDLYLTLTSAPTLLADVTILSGGSITGGFASINGALFGEDDTFALSFDHQEYQYQLFWNGDDTVSVRALSAIPEPTTAALSLIGFIGAGWMTRKKYCSV